MSKILRDELVSVLGVSKNNANAFVDNLSKRYLIDLVPMEDLALTEEEKIADVFNTAASMDGSDEQHEDPNTDENNAAGELNESLSNADLTDEEVKEEIGQDGVDEYREDSEQN